MPKFKAPQTHNVVWLHANGVMAHDRETGYERPFYRYAFKLVSDDPKIVHIGAVQTNSRMAALGNINYLIDRWSPRAIMAGTMTFETLADAMKAWR